MDLADHLKVLNESVLTPEKLDQLLTLSNKSFLFGAAFMVTIPLPR